MPPQPEIRPPSPSRGSLTFHGVSPQVASSITIVNGQMTRQERVGEIKAKVALTVNHASASAKSAIEKAGGSITLIEKKVLAADEAKRKKSEAKKGTSTKKPA